MNVDDLALLIEKTDTNGELLFSQKVPFLIDSLVKKHTPFKTIIVPMANLADMLEKYLMYPECFNTWIAIPSIVGCIDDIFS